MNIHIPAQWQPLLSGLLSENERKIIYVIGACDSGKSTLCRWLLHHLSQKFITAYVDCDPGQSSIGPPTTIGLSTSHPTENPAPDSWLHFIGSTSPQGHAMQTLTGIKKLTAKAIHLGAQKIILDSCGYVLGKSGREFQFQIIDLIQPHYLIPLQKTGELNLLLQNFTKNPALKIHRLPVSPAVVARTPSARQRYRESKLKDYFISAVRQQLTWQGIGVHGRIPNLRNPGACEQLLLAFCDVENYVIALGILEHIDLPAKTLRMFAPPFHHSRVVSIHFGSVYLTIQGEQVFPLTDV